MSWVTGLAVYLCLWWIVLFAVLPWGVRRHEEIGKGYDSGAPANPRLLLKVAATTAISGALWLAFYAVVHMNLISFRDFS